ncbi:MAG: TlpA disulfide reductase family protein [Myxococcota bacterium]
MFRWTVVALAALGCAPFAPPSAPSPLLGESLPSLQRPSLDGRRPQTEGAEVVVVKFFADFCEPCKKTLPAAEALHQARPEVRIIGVSEDEYRKDAIALVRRFGLTFPVIHDRANVVSGQFRVTALPAVFVADGQGTIRWVGPSTATEQDIEAAVDYVASLPR